MFYFKIALSFRKLTALLCLVCSLLFHSGVAQWSFLGLPELFTRALCLVWIELKLRRFRKATFMVLISGACICCKYVKSIHEYLISSLSSLFIYWLALLLLHSQKYSHWIRVLLYCCLLLAASMGTTMEQLPVKERLSQQFWQSQGCFTRGRAILEYNAFDVLLKCVLLANIKRLCWTLQVAEWGDVLVYTNDVLQCLHPITYKARYVQRCRVMRFMLFLIGITKNPILYSLY